MTKLTHKQRAALRRLAFYRRPIRWWIDETVLHPQFPQRVLLNLAIRGYANVRQLFWNREWRITDKGMAALRYRVRGRHHGRPGRGRRVRGEGLTGTDPRGTLSSDTLGRAICSVFVFSARFAAPVYRCRLSPEMHGPAGAALRLATQSPDAVDAAPGVDGHPAEVAAVHRYSTNRTSLCGPSRPSSLPGATVTLGLH